jgi:hypothetical protein
MADSSRIPHAFELQPTAPVPGGTNAAHEPDSPRHRIALVKGNERWNFRWEPGDESLLINRVAEMARDPDIPFDWFDAAVVCKHIAQPFGTPSQRPKSQ